MADKTFDGIMRFDENFYASLARMVNEEPVLARAMLSQLQALGIEKDKEFKSDAAVKELLRTAAHETQVSFVGNAANDGSQCWDDARCGASRVIGAKTPVTFETDGKLDVNA